MMCRVLVFVLALACLTLAPGAQAQTETANGISFAGGRFTITETDDFQKVLAFDGSEIARDYVVFYNRTVTVGGAPAALFDIGPGGNACGTSTLIVWKPDGKDLQSVRASDDCGSPPAAVTEGAIFFVPYLLPGASAPVQSWTPDEGMRIAGNLSFAPQPGTTWAELDAGGLRHVIELFSNEAVFEAAKAALGDELAQVAKGLVVNSGVDVLPSGVLYGSGCLPHACGEANAFMAADPANRKVYFAQQNGSGGERTWPGANAWPADVKKAMIEALARQ